KIGVTITDTPIKISSIQEEDRGVVISGQAFNVEVRTLKSGRQLLTFGLTDFSDSISCKFFTSPKEKEQIEIVNRIHNGDWLKVRGAVQYDTFSRELVLMMRDLNEESVNRRKDQADEKRVELHLHTSMSTMDGLIDPKNLV